MEAVPAPAVAADLGLFLEGEGPAEVEGDVAVLLESGGVGCTVTGVIGFLSMSLMWIMLVRHQGLGEDENTKKMKKFQRSH